MAAGELPFHGRTIAELSRDPERAAKPLSGRWTRGCGPYPPLLARDEPAVKTGKQR